MYEDNCPRNYSCLKEINMVNFLVTTESIKLVIFLHNSIYVILGLSLKMYLFNIFALILVILFFFKLLKQYLNPVLFEKFYFFLFFCNNLLEKITNFYQFFYFLLLTSTIKHACLNIICVNI